MRREVVHAGEPPKVLSQKAVKKFETDFELLLGTADNSLTGQARGWLKFGPMQVYIRISKKLVSGEIIRCVQIANVNTHEKHQRKGIFREMIATINALTPLPIFIESVLDPLFAEALKRNGFVVVNNYQNSIFDLISPIRSGI